MNLRFEVLQVQIIASTSLRLHQSSESQAFRKSHFEDANCAGLLVGHNSALQAANDGINGRSLGFLKPEGRRCLHSCGCGCCVTTRSAEAQAGNLWHNGTWHAPKQCQVSVEAYCKNKLSAGQYTWAPYSFLVIYFVSDLLRYL